MKDNRERKRKIIRTICIVVPMLALLIGITIFIQNKEKQMQNSMKQVPEMSVVSEVQVTQKADELQEIQSTETMQEEKQEQNQELSQQEVSCYYKKDAVSPIEEQEIAWSDELLSPTMLARLEAIVASDKIEDALRAEALKETENAGILDENELKTLIRENRYLQMFYEDYIEQCMVEEMTGLRADMDGDGIEDIIISESLGGTGHAVSYLLFAGTEEGTYEQAAIQYGVGISDKYILTDGEKATLCVKPTIGKTV